MPLCPRECACSRQSVSLQHVIGESQLQKQLMVRVKVNGMTGQRARDLPPQLLSYHALYSYSL